MSRELPHVIVIAVRGVDGVVIRFDSNRVWRTKAAVDREVGALNRAQRNAYAYAKQLTHDEWIDRLVKTLDESPAELKPRQGTG